MGYVWNVFMWIYKYKREEVKIQAWENHEKRKAEMEMKRMEVLLFKIFILNQVTCRIYVKYIIVSRGINYNSCKGKASSSLQLLQPLST